MTSHTHCCVIAAIILMALTHFTYALPKPQNPWAFHPQFTDECKTKGDVETLCQRCAKETKSNIVYPMCCEGREDARTWCDKYLSFPRRQY